MTSAEQLLHNNKLRLALSIAMETLEQISVTPNNRGAKGNASATLRFLETQFKDLLDTQI